MNTAPPRLVVHALPGGYAQEIATTLAGIASDEESRQERLSADEAGQQLTKDPDARLCIVYEDPVCAICAAMSAREDIGAFLRNWTSCTEQALTLHRRNRRRSTILEASHLQRFAAAGLARLDLDADSRALGEIANPAPPPVLLDYVLAQAILAEAQEAQAAYEELVASAQLLSNEESPNPGNRALQAYETLRHQQDEAKERQGDQSLEQQLEEKTARIDLLLAQQSDMVFDLEMLEKELEQNKVAATREKDEVQAQLDAASARNGLLSSQQAAMVADMEALEQQLEATKAQAETLQRDLWMQLKAEEDTRERVILERDQRTAELKAAVDALERSSADLAHRDKELAAAQGEIHRIMNSRSMRLTRSLRRISGLLRRRR